MTAADSHALRCPWCGDTISVESEHDGAWGTRVAYIECNNAICSAEWSHRDGSVLQSPPRWEATND